MGVCARRHEKIRFVIIALVGGVVLVACLGSGVPAAPTGSPLAQSTAITTSSIAPPTMSSASPTAPSMPPPTITPRLAPPTLTPLPAYYVPHPALWQITPPVESDWHRYDLQWESDSVLRYLVEETNDCGTGCRYKKWGQYTLSGTSTAFTETICTPVDRTVTPSPVPPKYTEIEGAEVVWYSSSPDGSRDLILTRVTDPLPGPQLGNRERLPEYTVYQGWFDRADGSGLRAVFYTVENFSFRWMRNSRYVLAVGDVCYGGDSPPEFVAARGLFTIDADTLLIHMIDPDYVTNCEGSIGYRIAPDGQHVIYEPGIVTALDGVDQVRVCGSDSHARSYSWSQDGRYAYVACDVGDLESDVLRRYDTQTGENLVLAGPGCGVTFRAIEMAVSPGQTHVAFVWGNTTFMPVEPYGVWMLDLTLVDDCR
jgi:hypothetical protein